jgi:hypothetical protein
MTAERSMPIRSNQPRARSGEERLQRDLAVGRELLEERVGVVPRPQLVGAEATGEPPVELGLPSPERLVGAPLDVLEDAEQPSLFELLEVERHAVVVGVAEVARDGVAQPRQLAHAPRDDRADLLGRLPRPPPQVDVVGRLEDALDVVVAQALAVDLRTVRGEVALQARGEGDDLLALRLVHLVARQREAQDLELPPQERLVDAVVEGGLHGTKGVCVSLDPP